jgi:hypothetical protein
VKQQENNRQGDRQLCLLPTLQAGALSSCASVWTSLCASSPVVFSLFARSFVQHYGIGILPTKSYTPRHKGKVERGIDCVKHNALKGQAFDSLADENRHLLEWEESVADTRIHGTTRRQVGKVFDEVERSALQTPRVRSIPRQSSRSTRKLDVG